MQREYAQKQVHVLRGRLDEIEEDLKSLRADQEALDRRRDRQREAIAASIAALKDVRREIRDLRDAAYAAG